ncbi:MAG TPA: Gfo/Idh/MocA family oxidoreductase [Thermomicrobiales bacterium]|nr:Gfo/Idh/MocA family oxidoreductase [Thermomicrobiales bacterium]
MSETSPIRLGIIGTGLAVQKLHWPALARLKDQFVVTAFTNRSRAKAEHFADYSGTPMSLFVEETAQLLARDDVDAVLISLPIPLNLPTTLAALEAGKNVICEKPAGANEQEARAFVELGNRFPDRTILIAENWFYRDDLRYARSLLDAGAIGDMHLVSWRTVSQLIPREGEFSSTPWRHHAEYDGGPHLDAGVHHTAQLRLLCGDVSRLHGETQDTNKTHVGPSDLVLSFRLVNGAVGNYTASWPDIPVPAGDNDMHIYGTDGQMAIGRDGITVTRADGANVRYRIQQRDGGYYNEFRNFHEAVVYGAPLVGTITQSFRNMELVLKSLESARKGQVISLSELPESLSATAVPLWKPYGQEELYGDLDVTVTQEAL